MSEIPVIVLTARDDETLASDALHRGAEDYLLKGSLNQVSLLRSIRYAIEHHRGLRDLARVRKELENANRDLERRAGGTGILLSTAANAIDFLTLSYNPIKGIWIATIAGLTTTPLRA